jgi:transposase-like protein
MTVAKKQYLNIKETIEWLGARGIEVSKDTLYNWAREHSLAIKIGMRWYYSLMRLEAILNDANQDPVYQASAKYFHKPTHEAGGRKVGKSPRKRKG